MTKLSAKNRRVRDVLADTEGLSTVEYVIILCLIAVVCFAIWRQFGTHVKEKVEVGDGMVTALPSSHE